MGVRAEFEELVDPLSGGRTNFGGWRSADTNPQGRRNHRRTFSAEIRHTLPPADEPPARPSTGAGTRPMGSPAWQGRQSRPDSMSAGMTALLPPPASVRLPPKVEIIAPVERKSPAAEATVALPQQHNNAKDAAKAVHPSSAKKANPATDPSGKVVITGASVDTAAASSTSTELDQHSARTASLPKGGSAESSDTSSKPKSEGAPSMVKMAGGKTPSTAKPAKKRTASAETMAATQPAASKTSRPSSAFFSKIWDVVAGGGLRTSDGFPKDEGVIDPASGVWYDPAVGLPSDGGPLAPPPTAAELTENAADGSAANATAAPSATASKGKTKRKARNKYAKVN